MASRLFFSALLLLGSCSAAYPEKNKPSPELALTGRIVDEANLIDSANKITLSKKLADAEKLYGPQFVIVTVKSLGEKNIEDYSINLARHWKLGDAHRNDGLILLVAPHEHKVRIEVGIGLEGSFSDPFCKQIIEQKIIPSFNLGHYQAGIIAGADSILAKIKNVPTLDLNDNQASKTKQDAA